MFFRDTFKVEGRVSFPAARIKNVFVWRKIVDTKDVELDLQSARIGTLWDDEDSWPEKGKLFLHGLEYDGIDEDAPRDARSRIDWLSRQGGDKYRPQPYNQLAKVLKNEGHEQDAKRILIEKENIKWRHEESKVKKALVFIFWKSTACYGYRPSRAALIGLVIVLLGCLAFGYGHKKNIIKATKEIEYVYENKTSSTAIVPKVCKDYPHFSSIVYSIDMFVPLVDLYQAKYWLIDSDAGTKIGIKQFAFKGGELLRFYMWFEIMMGWVITTLLVASIAKLSRSE